MISEVDRVLRQTRSRKFWTIFTSHRLQRQALEQCRNFLVMQQRPTPPSAQTALQLIPTTNPAAVGRAETHLALELQRLRQEVMNPLRADMAAFGNQRTALQEEVQALMFQKAQLVADCETLRLNLTQTIPTASQKAASQAHSLDEAELARLQSLRERTDFLLTSMDSSLQLVFGSMQKNVEVYQTTLHAGLDRMHHLGYQGEVLFSTLVNRLAQQVGRDMAIVLPERAVDLEADSALSSSESSSDSQMASTPLPAPSEAAIVNSPMNESIDFFFADFDTTSPAESHLSEQPSSLNIRPQQVDAIIKPLSLGVASTDVARKQPMDDDSLTIEGLFTTLGKPFQPSSEPEMTLSEMDDLFSDVPSL